MPVQYSYTSTPPMDRTACTESQCLYSTAIPLLPLWAVQPVQSLSACTVQLYLYSPYGPYSLYRASVPVQGCTLLHNHIWIIYPTLLLIIDISQFRLVQVSSTVSLNFNIHAHQFRLESPSNAKCKCSKLFKILVHPSNLICSRDIKNKYFTMCTYISNFRLKDIIVVSNICKECLVTNSSQHLLSLINSYLLEYLHFSSVFLLVELF